MNDKTEAFMEEFNKLTASHPFTPYLSVLDNYAVFEIQPLGGQILLGFIQTIDKGRGDGSKALRWFLDLADKHGVEVTGGIRRLGKDGLTVTELRRWYKRHGFKVDRYLSITRPPSTKERTMSESKQKLDRRLVDLIKDYGRNKYHMGQLSMCLQVTLAHEDKESPFGELAFRYKQLSNDGMNEMMEIIKELFPESGWTRIDDSDRADQK